MYSQSHVLGMLTLFIPSLHKGLVALTFFLLVKIFSVHNYG